MWFKLLLAYIATTILFIVAVCLMGSPSKFFRSLGPRKTFPPRNADLNSLYDLETVPASVGLYQFPVVIKDKKALYNNYGITKIPKIIHFVYGLKQDSIFGLVQYLSVASAYVVHKPYIIYLHCANIPTGFYWELVSNMVVINIIRDVNMIFGNPVIHYAHKADIVRLRALLKFGGIYLDLDMISLVSFDHLLNNDFVMGIEKNVGLCNGVIISSKESKFLKIWYNAYKTFNDSHWNYHSVILPNKLSKNPIYAKDITVLNEKTFFWPLWNKNGLDLMYRNHIYDYKENLAVHLWDSEANKRVTKGLNMMWLLQNRSTLLSRMVVYVPVTLISVIMPCYNQRKYIGDAIASVVHQTWQLWEIIVVDDGSPDSCGRYVINEIAPYLNSNPSRQLIKVVFTKGIGLANARNMAIELAVGFWICALDSDDRIGKNYFKEAEAAITADPNLNLVFANQQFFDQSVWLWKVPDFDTQRALTYGPLPVMSIYLRSMWQQVGGYSCVLPYGNEDYDFWMKLMEVGVRAKKLLEAGTTSYYRYKKSSMMRNSMNTSHTEHVMLRTRHLSLHSIDSIFEAHQLIGSMALETVHHLQSKPGITDLDMAFIYFWLGLYEQKQGNANGAISMYTKARDVNNPNLKWQAEWYLGTALCQIDNKQARELLSKTAAKYPELLMHHKANRMIETCNDFGIA